MTQNRPPIAAYREAGHAVFCWRLGVRLNCVWIVPASTSGNTVIDDEHDAKRMPIIYLAGALAQMRAHPGAWPFNAHNDCLKFDELTAPLLSDNPGVRQRLWAVAETMIDDTRTWQAIEALATALDERSTLDGAEASEIIRSAYGDDASIA